jgi:hypothetical protein
MRAIITYFGLCAGFLVSLPGVFGQTNPPPADPREMVTQEAHILSTPAERSAAIDLLDHARRNYELHGISTPYSLKVSFETNGATQSEGAGTMEELYDGHSRWRWTEQLHESHVVHIGSQKHVYGTNPSEPVPLRVQLVRSVLLRPIVHDPGAFVIRAAKVEHEGKEMLCLLFTYSPSPEPAFRSWAEREDCFDAATGLLQVWSEAPGIYAVYDYSGAAEFHGHTFPRQISVFEEGRLAVQVHVESLEDAPDMDPNLFKPTPEMLDAGESFTLAAPRRLQLRADPSDGPTSRLYQPLIVHATLDATNANVLDAEALQTSDEHLSHAALDLVRSTSFEPTGFQQEAFIAVHFHMPAARPDGPPLFHTSPHWVIVGHRGKSAPVEKPPHHGK